MGATAFISICIPAYKRVSFLQRLLDSIQIQTYRHYEVIVTDDSPDKDVFELTRNHPLASSIRYFKNEKPLGTPENWNEGLRRANGQWIKLMHDDDWFSRPDALEIFANAITEHPNQSFFFSAFTNVFLDKNSNTKEVVITDAQLKMLARNPLTLLSSNVIGPPSVVLHKKDAGILYDPTLKWLVDIDYYIRFLGQKEAIYLTDNLIKVGMGSDQVTQQVFRNPLVEIPENLYLLNKMGIVSMKSWIVYDAFWRFLRNLDIRNMQTIRQTSYDQPVPEIIQSMIAFQSCFPRWILKIGFISKMLMFAHYLFQYSKITRG